MWVCVCVHKRARVLAYAYVDVCVQIIDKCHVNVTQNDNRFTRNDGITLTRICSTYT